MKDTMEYFSPVEISNCGPKMLYRRMVQYRSICMHTKVASSFRLSPPPPSRVYSPPVQLSLGTAHCNEGHCIGHGTSH